MAVDWGTIAQVGLNLASNYSKGRNDARNNAIVGQQTQNAQAIAQNTQQNNVLLQMAQLELLRKEMAERNRMERARQAAIGGTMANVQDVRVDAPSHITRFNVSGGLRPSAMGPAGRAAGQELSGQALAALMEGDSFMPVRPVGPVNLNANMPRESTFDKIMALAGTVGNAYQAYQTQRGSGMGPQAGTPMAVQGGVNSSYEDALRRMFGRVNFPNG